MSFITSGVKIGLRPSTARLRSISLALSLIRFPLFLENELALGRLEAVVVVELLTAHELLEGRGSAQFVDAELTIDELRVRVSPLAGDAVDPEGPDLAADVDDAVVHGVTETMAGVAADDLTATLHHEAGVGTDGAHREDGSALLVDAGAGAEAALDDQIATEREAAEEAAVKLKKKDKKGSWWDRWSKTFLTFLENDVE